MKQKQKRPPLPSWRETFRCNGALLALLFQRCPTFLWSKTVWNVWNAIYPYFTIYVSALLLDEIAGRRDPQRLVLLALLELGVSAGGALLSAFITKWRNVASGTVNHQVRRLYSKKLMDLDYVSVEDPAVQQKLAAIERDSGGGMGIWNAGWAWDRFLTGAASVCGGVALTVSLFARQVPEGAGALAVLNHPAVLALAAALMLAVTVLSPMMNNRAGRYFAEGADEESETEGIRREYYRLSTEPKNGADIRLYRQDAVMDRLLGRKDFIYGSRGKYAKLAWGPMGALTAGSAALSVAFTALAYGFVALKALGGAFGAGAVTQYIASLTKLSGGMSSLFRSLGEFRNNTPYAKQILEFLSLPDKMESGSREVRGLAPGAEVEFRDVSFRYPGAEQYALRCLNLKFRAGDRIAVVGENGSGKTTFIKLLCRLYDPTEGRILLNGVDIREYRHGEYLQLFSVVFQDFSLLALPLGENVAAAREYDAPRAEDCLRRAGFGPRLESLPRGLETPVYQAVDPSGVEFSGGEAQKIALARALYKNAPVMVLDEPTAALDPLAEAEVYENFNNLVAGKTAVYISHRLSSCRFCGDILVFRRGELVQRGAHEALVGQDGPYRDLWDAQAQYYRAEPG